MDWYPRYPELYAADTLHLSAEQDGIYGRLIDWYMINRRPPPDNDQALAAIARIGLDQWLANATVIRAFFKRRNGHLHLKRCDIELDRQDRRLSTFSEKGKKGAEMRWKNNKQKQGPDSQGYSQPMPGLLQEDRRGEKKEESLKDSPGDLHPREAEKAPSWKPVYERLEAIINSGVPLSPGSIIAGWLANGADPELDIYPTVATLATKAGSPHNLRYFDRAIRQAVADRTAPARKANGHDPAAEGPMDRAVAAFHAAVVEFSAPLPPTPKAIRK